ncbi:MAG: CopD family protein [Rhodospirillales bacterium]|jgi:uncharacterized membrane protein
MSVYVLVKALHLLAAVVWVGGMFFAYLVLRPSMGVLEPNQRLLLNTQVFQRFFRAVWHAMPLSIITGFGMVFVFLGGMQTQSPKVHAMMALGLIMSAVFLYIFFGPYKRFRRTTDKATMAAALDSIRKLIGVNLVVGLVTIVLGAIS